MAPLTAWLPARVNQDFDLIIKVVGPALSILPKDWTLVTESLIQHGLSVMTQRVLSDDEVGDCALQIRIATRPFHSMGHGCDILVSLSEIAPEFSRFGLQRGSVLIWEPPSEHRLCQTVPEGVIVYAVPLKKLCPPDEKGLQGKALVALGMLLHLLGVPEPTLCHWISSLSAPRSFATGFDYANRAMEKRDAYSLPLASAKARCAMMLSPEQAILLGYAMSACECRTACEAELVSSHVQWTAKHLTIARSMVSVLEGDIHPGVRAYRGPQRMVMALLPGDDSAIASCLNGFKTPHVFVAADIPDALRLLVAGHDLIHAGFSDGVVVLIEETIALRHQTVEVRSLLDTMRWGLTSVSPSAIRSSQERSVLPAERDGDTEAEIGFVAWGAAQGVVRDAVALCRNFGLRVAGFYPKLIVPFQQEEMDSFVKTVGRVVLVESGQTRGYWNRLRMRFPLELAVLTPQPGQPLTPMDIFLREGLGAV
jgi:hypothetical protein